MTIIEAADRFLADCVRQAATNSEWPQWPEARNSLEFSNTIRQRAELHGISVLLARNPSELSKWPGAIAEKIREEARLAGLWEEIHKSAIAKLVEALSDNGINSVVMKGTALAYLYYDDPAMRRRGDTDLLIDEGDLEATRNLFAQSGHERREDPYGLCYQETWLIDCGPGIIHALDLHWQPADRPTLQRILKGEEFIASARALPRLSASAQAPDPVVMLVHGAINQAWHVARGYLVDEERIKGGRRLIWSVDYSLLTAQFTRTEWEQLTALCESRDAAKVVHTALQGAVQDLSINVPEGVMATLENAGQSSKTFDYIAKADTLSDLIADLAAAGDAETRVRLLMMSAFAPRRHLTEKYPELSHWPTFALQLRRYADMVARPLSKKANQ